MDKFIKIFVLTILALPGLAMAGTIVFSATSQDYTPERPGERVVSKTAPVGMLELGLDWGGKQYTVNWPYQSQISIRYKNAVQSATFYDYVNSKTYTLVDVADILASGLVGPRLEEELANPNSTGYYQSNFGGKLQMIDELGNLALLQFIFESYQDPEIADDLFGALTHGFSSMPIDSLIRLNGDFYSQIKSTARIPEPSTLALFFITLLGMVIVRRKSVVIWRNQ
jgi:hypothetical protein